MGDEGFNHPRMADYMRPEDLNLAGCVSLASAVLEAAAEEYLQAARHCRAEPKNKAAAAHLKTCRAFYKSDYFRALSAGVTDGEAALKALDERL